MTVPGNLSSPLLATAAAGPAPAAGATINRSLRFNSGDSTYLSRNDSNGDSRKKFTFSFWIKKLKTQFEWPCIIASTLNGNNGTQIRWNADRLQIYSLINGNYGIGLMTTRKFRDYSSWYHVVISVDTTQGTASNRAKIYINGVQETAFDDTHYPDPNFLCSINVSGNTFNVGRRPHSSNNYIDAYLADIHFLDGIAAAASDFGAPDSSGVWQPTIYSGLYGTNGFHLLFSDNSSNAALGTDSSGNSNNFSVYNLSVASGAGNDSLVDTPEQRAGQTETRNTGYKTVGGSVVGNYCVWNPLSSNGAVTISNGNLDTVNTGSGYDNPRASLGVSSGKWYWEVEITAFAGGFHVGLATPESQNTSFLGNSSGTWAYTDGGGKYAEGSGSSYGAAFNSVGKVVGVAFDADAGTVTFYNDGTSQGTAFTGLTNGPYLPAMYARVGNTGGSWNFGQRPFTHPGPDGYKTLNTANLPDPTIADGSQYFDAKLWDGIGSQGGSNQTISGYNFAPQFAWIKNRSATEHHALFDRVRGATKVLYSSLPYSEATQANGLISFTSDGFQLGIDGKVNGGNQAIVGWAWNAGVNSNATYIVKVVSDNGNKYRFGNFGTSAVTLELAEGSTYVFDQSDGSNSGHPLRFSTTSNGTHGGGSEYTTGVTVTGTPGSAGAKTTIVVASGAPILFYYCTQHSGMGGQANTNSTAGASNFDGSIPSQVHASQTAGFSICTYTGSTGNQNFGHGLNVAPEFIAIKNRSSSAKWFVMVDVGSSSHKYGHFNTNDQLYDATAQPVSNTTVTLGNNNAWFGANDDNYVAYCFASVAGFSAIGKYTGNNSSTNGPLVFLSFKPAFLLIKRINGSEQWAILDDARDTGNPTDDLLWANSTSYDPNSVHDIDFLSNGFKVRGTHVMLNGSGDTYAYLAFASHPFQTARAR